ncbi:MAG: EamA family transporter [Synechococcales cyanobacterium]
MPKGLIWLILAAILWGTVGVSIRGWQTVQSVGGITIGFWRMGLAAPILWGLIGVGHLAKPVQRQHWPWLGLYGLMMALYQLTTVEAISRVGVTVAILLAICLSPLFVVGLATLWLGERLTRRVALGGVMAMAGALCLVDFAESQAGSLGGGERILGMVLAVGSAFCYGVIVLCSRRLAADYHPLQTLGVSFSLSALILGTLVGFQGWQTPDSLATWGYALYLAGIPTVLAYVVFLWGMRSSTATVGSIMTLLEPLVATLLAAVIFGETLQPWSGLGAGLLLGSVLILR